MKPEKIYFVLFSLMLSASSASAQNNIIGDTIFVNTDDELQIKLPSDNIELRWTSLNPAYATSPGPSSIFVHAKTENAKCSNLSVFEGPGPRNHNFIFCYQKNISKVIYDYSTVKKVQQRIKEIETRDEAKKLVAKSASQDQPAQKTTTTAAAEEKTSGGYYLTIEEGDKALKNGLLNEAQAKFEEVLSVKPDNEYSQKKLVDIKNRIAQKEALAKKELSDKVNALKTAANKSFNDKKYDEAIKGYTDALALQPNDVFSKSQIEIIKNNKAENELEAKQAAERLAKKEKDDKIDAMRTTAMKAFNDKRYDDAITGYNAVLVISPNDLLSTKQIDIIQKIKTENEIKKQQEAKNKDREATFKIILANADKAFDNKEYQVAKAGYLAAKDLKPNDASIDAKIKSINSKISDKENEDEYNAAISIADEAKKAGDYEKAKTAYTKASKFFSDRKYPADQIAEINKIAADLVAQQEAEKQRQANESQNNTSYMAAIEKADKALEKKDYSGAKSIYTQAVSLKPEEVYPKEKLTEIAILLDNADKEKKAKSESDALANDLNKKYNQALEKGKAALERKEYNIAKAEYTKASELKSTEPEPKDRLDFIEKRIVGTDVDSKYDAAVAKGNTALAEKNFPVALENYLEAQKVKPLEAYALNQVRAVQDLITRDSIIQAESQRKEAIKVEEEVRRKRFEEGMTAYANYEIAAQIANYEDQLLNLKHFLNIIPDASELNTYQFNAGAKIDFAKKKIDAIRAYLTRTKGSYYQLEAIPYLSKDLEKKYESINFTAPPEEQAFIKINSDGYNESIKTGKELLAEKPRLTIADSSANIKLTVQAISFKEGDAYFKFVITNNSSAEFLTGPMQLSLVKKNGTVKSDPAYISSFPIILPGKEFVIVYKTKVIEVNDKDVLFLDINDRLKTKKLHLAIPARTYNEEKAR